MSSISAVLLIAVFASLQTAVVGQQVVTPGPLLGSPGGGDQFDDGVTAVIPHVVHVSSLTICDGDAVDGIQANYTLEDGKSFVSFIHGMKNSHCTKKIIEFKEDETIVRIEGKTQASFGYISQLTLFTTVVGELPFIYGPFGLGGDSDIPFSMAGSTVGFFGRSGTILDAIGLYIDSSVPLSFYKKSDVIGGEGGDGFDDFSSDNEKNPVKISNMIVNYGAHVNGIQVTYTLPNGVSSTVLHGVLSRDTLQFDGILDFANNEWITQVNISSGASHVVDYLFFQTTNSKGSVRSYGPFGKPTMGNITTIYGVVYGFFGRSGHHLDALGFYI